jgi:hypothetical protein
MITWPAQLVNDTIEEIRNAIGRPVIFNIRVSGIGCTYSGCFLDPITNLSVDPWCPECHGTYWKDTISGITISGHVLWGTAESPYIRSGGIIPEGDCKVTIVFSSVNEKYVKDAEGFIVDGKSMSLKSYRLRGVPTPNRLAIFMTEEGNNG